MPFIISEETGRLIKEWCESGSADSELEFNNAIIEVNNSSSVSELTTVYNKYPKLKDNTEFIKILQDKKASLTK